MPTEAQENCSFVSETVPVVPAAQQAPALGPTTFFCLPRELRDLVYSHLFEAVYKQSRNILHLEILVPGKSHDPPEGGVRAGARIMNFSGDEIIPGHARKGPGARISDRLAIMQASRRLWEEGSVVFYGDHLFRFHVGSATLNATFLTQRTVKLMQDIEISLGASKGQDSIRILQLFGTSQVSRHSCLVKLKFREIEFMYDDVIEALRQFTGFKTLTFEVDAPDVVLSRQPGAPIPWISVILAYIKLHLTAALGAGTFANDDGYRRLIFKPQVHVQASLYCA